MSIPTEAIEAAMSAADGLGRDGNNSWSDAAIMSAALTAAAPYIQAAAVAEALEQLAVSFEATASCASYVGTEDIMETWLNAAQRARAATIEGKSE